MKLFHLISIENLLFFELEHSSWKSNISTESQKSVSQKYYLCTGFFFLQYSFSFKKHFETSGFSPLAQSKFPSVLYVLYSVCAPIIHAMNFFFPSLITKKVKFQFHSLMRMKKNVISRWISSSKVLVPASRMCCMLIFCPRVQGKIKGTNVLMVLNFIVHMYRRPHVVKNVFILYYTTSGHAISCCPF